MTVARSWKDVRADAAGRGLVDETQVAAHRQRLDAEVGTLQAYVEALGGRLRMIAEFGDENLVIGP